MPPGLPPALQLAAEAVADAETRIASAGEQLGEAARLAATRRATLADHIKTTAHELGLSVRTVCARVAARMGLSPSTVKGGLYDYPYRADVLARCVEVLTDEVAQRAAERAASDRVAA